MMKLKGTTTWVTRWEVESMSSMDKYVVAQKADGSWGCSCPRWRFSKSDDRGHRPDCKHIRSVRDNEPLATLEQLTKMERYSEIEKHQRQVKAAAASGLRREPEVFNPTMFVVQTRRTIKLVD